MATTGAASDVGSPVSKLSHSSVTPAFCCSSNCLASGKSRRMGMENNAHHNPEPPIANRRISVDPPACCTGSTVTVATRRQRCIRQQCQVRKRVQFRAKASLYRQVPRRARRIRRGAGGMHIGKKRIEGAECGKRGFAVRGFIMRS